MTDFVTIEIEISGANPGHVEVKINGQRIERLIALDAPPDTIKCSKEVEQRSPDYTLRWTINARKDDFWIEEYYESWDIGKEFLCRKLHFRKGLAYESSEL